MPISISLEPMYVAMCCQLFVFLVTKPLKPLHTFPLPDNRMVAGSRIKHSYSLLRVSVGYRASAILQQPEGMKIIFLDISIVREKNY